MSHLTASGAHRVLLASSHFGTAAWALVSCGAPTVVGTGEEAAVNVVQGKQGM